MKSYNYQLEVFQGPLDLLLHLIEKHKIDIYDIPIADITEQYMEYLGNWNQFDIRYSSEFLVMAATLLHIKSRLLLPKRQEYEEIEDDPRDILVEKLVEFKQIKELMEILKERAEAQEAVFPRAMEVSELGRDKIYPISLSLLQQTFIEVYSQKKNSAPKVEPVIVVDRESYSVKDKMLSLLNYLSKKTKISFFDYLDKSENKEELIVSFMGVLELLKLQCIHLEILENSLWLVFNKYADFVEEDLTF